jgi:hypothetical protein
VSPSSEGERRNEFIQVIKLLGAEYMRVLDRKSTHLVGPHDKPSEAMDDIDRYRSILIGLCPDVIGSEVDYDLTNHMRVNIDRYRPISSTASCSLSYQMLPATSRNAF